MKHLYYFLVVALCAAFMFSCKPEAKDLTLQGVWNEEVSMAYDTINHNEIHSFSLDCDKYFSFIRTMHYRKNSDSINYDMLSYDEYIKGSYTVENGKIYFSGNYYRGIEDGALPADSTFPNYGRYFDTVTYVIDSKCLMFNLDEPERQNIRRFSQEESYGNCGW